MLRDAKAVCGGLVLTAPLTFFYPQAIASAILLVMDDQNSLKQLPKPPPTVARINDQGLTEYINVHTGQVVAISQGPNDDYLSQRFDNLVRIDTPQGAVFIEKHMDPSRVIKASRSQPKLSLTWAHLIVEKMLTPTDPPPNTTKRHQPRLMTFKQAVQKLELPLPLVVIWRAESKEFNEIIEQGLKAQAQLLQDEALERSRDASPKEVPLASLQVDTLMKQAKQADQARFGDKQKVDHTHQVAATIIVETGIRRSRNVDGEIPPGYEDAIKNAIPAKAERLDAGAAIHGSFRDDLLRQEEKGQAEKGEAAEATRPESTTINRVIHKPSPSGEQSSPSEKKKELPRFTDESTAHSPFEVKRPGSLLEQALKFDDTVTKPLPNIEDLDF